MHSRFWCIRVSNSRSGSLLYRNARREMKTVAGYSFLFIFASSELFVRGFLAAPTYQQEPVSYKGSRPFEKQFMHLCGSASSTSGDAAAATTLDEQIASNVQILIRAADTKDVDSDVVCNALSDLEKQMRQKARENPDVAADMMRMLNGSWRLIFTTGTGETQKKYGKINYFPLKAVQSFHTVDCDPMKIENGIYVGDFPLIRFSGTMEFDLKKRRLEFDFDQVLVLSLFDIKLGKGDAAKLGSTSGLGSDSNVKNAEKGRNAFFNWISADEAIATARGAGGGLALWKRMP
jgi:PAP_fibrillin